MTRSVEQIVERCENSLFDVAFTVAKRWKAEGRGRRCIGFMPVFAPREIVHAAGALPVHVVGAGDWLEVIRGDAYYQSYLCHIPRSTVEMAVSGRLDFLDGMLFPSTCDVIRNLSGMWQMLKPDCYVRYVDVPQNYDVELGGAFWEGELGELARELGELTGVEVTDERLRASIEVYADHRRALESLMSLRREQPTLTPVSECYAVLRAGNEMTPESHAALIREYVEAARTRPVRDVDGSRVVVVGAFCEQPPLGLLKTIERSGCFVVEDDMLLVNRWYTEPVSTEGPALRALAEAFVRHTVPTAVMYSPRAGRGKALVERVRRSGAEGVIFAAPSFCTPALLDQPMLEAELDREGIPYTSFKYAENTGQFHSIREQTGTFADTMKLWGAA